MKFPIGELSQGHCVLIYHTQLHRGTVARPKTFARYNLCSTMFTCSDQLLRASFMDPVFHSGHWKHIIHFRRLRLFNSISPAREWNWAVSLCFVVGGVSLVLLFGSVIRTMAAFRPSVIKPLVIICPVVYVAPSQPIYGRWGAGEPVLNGEDIV